MKNQLSIKPIYGWLVFAVILIGLVVLFWPADAKAQTTNSSNSASGSAANVDANTVSGAASIINYPADTTSKITTSGETTIKNAPGLGSLALGGGHPCAYSPASAQISIIGGGIGGGAMKVDSACMLMIMGEAGDPQAKRAAQYMLAARDKGACAAMQAAGMVTGCATTKPSPLAVSTKGPAAPTALCRLEGRKLRFQASSVEARDSELANCKAHYGLR